MCYAAYKLWNCCNYERKHYQELDLPVPYPNWYYQKSVHKDDLWYKQLPSQTAQEVCKKLDKGWKSFYALEKSKGIENPHPPKFKQEPMEITYMENGIVHGKGSSLVRLSIPAGLKRYMADTYGIREDFLYLKDRNFRNTDNIKQIRLYPPKNGNCVMHIVYEVPDVRPLPDNGHYLSIDMGLHNLFTCYDSATGESFILGRNYLSICRRYDSKISRAQSQWYSQQSAAGIKYPKMSKRVQLLYEKKGHTVYDYLHKLTTWLAEECVSRDIHTVVIGDITGIRKDNDHGKKTNQKLHGLPYRKIYVMLQYKLAMRGITLIMQKESFSSQCSPQSPKVSKRYAKPGNREMRGLYRDGDNVWNADAVGAYNILRLYKACGPDVFPAIQSPVIINVAV
jgi:putative transposase